MRPRSSSLRRHRDTHGWRLSLPVLLKLEKRARGHFVTLIEICVLQMRGISLWQYVGLLPPQFNLLRQHSIPFRYTSFYRSFHILVFRLFVLCHQIFCLIEVKYASSLALRSQLCVIGKVLINTPAFLFYSHL